jgi:phosphoribosylaminoimidazole-succinocarboxamide synthase
MIELIGKELADKIENVSLKLYSKASEYALSKGIIIADTKFEFGLDESGELYLIDEVLTPDSSRFWPLDDYDVGRSQKRLDYVLLRC